jgi:LPXTG-motif cell wall-anchored protein
VPAPIAAVPAAPVPEPVAEPVVEIAEKERENSDKNIDNIGNIRKPWYIKDENSSKWPIFAVFGAIAAVVVGGLVFLKRRKKPGGKKH